MRNLEAHPVTQLVRPMTDDEFSGLVGDIARKGQLEAIKVYGGKIIDGVHRYKACVKLGIEAKVEEWVGTESELVEYVRSMNIERRHLSPSERAMAGEKMAQTASEVAARREALKRGEPGLSGDNPGLTMREAARLMNIGTASIQRARVVRQKGTPELIEAVEKGNMTVARASEIARKPKAEQRAAVEGPRPRNPLLGRQRGKPIPQQVNRAIDSIEVMMGILETAMSSPGSFDGARAEWSGRLRPLRTTLSKFIRWCQE